MIYMQAGIQIVLLFLIYRFGYQKSLLACLGAVIVSFVISVSFFTASFLGSLRLLLPEFTEGVFNEGFVVLITAASAWSVLYVVRLRRELRIGDRKSTRLNSSHVAISYAVFCLKKKI